MKNVRIVESFDDDDIDDMKDHYDLDYSKSRPNRFVDNVPLTVVLDDDVAKVYRTSSAVNDALRGLIEQKAS